MFFFNCRWARAHPARLFGNKNCQMSMYTPRLLQQPRDYFTVCCSYARHFILSSPRKCGVHAHETVIKKLMKRWFRKNNKNSFPCFFLVTYRNKKLACKSDNVTNFCTLMCCPLADVYTTGDFTPRCTERWWKHNNIHSPGGDTHDSHVVSCAAY